MKKSWKIGIIVAGILMLSGAGILLRGRLKVMATEVIYFARGDIPEITVDFSET